jgi:hypothetical protein
LIRWNLARILLACGCSISRRDLPRNGTQKFLCDSGMAHGYRGQTWKMWSFEGREEFNPLAQEDE